MAVSRTLGLQREALPSALRRLWDDASAGGLLRSAEGFGAPGGGQVVVLAAEPGRALELGLLAETSGLAVDVRSRFLAYVHAPGAADDTVGLRLNARAWQARVAAVAAGDLMLRWDDELHAGSGGLGLGDVGGRGGVGALGSLAALLAARVGDPGERSGEQSGDSGGLPGPEALWWRAGARDVRQAFVAQLLGELSAPRDAAGTGVRFGSVPEFGAVAATLGALLADRIGGQEAWMLPSSPSLATLVSGWLWHVELLESARALEGAARLEEPAGAEPGGVRLWRPSGEAGGLPRAQSR